MRITRFGHAALLLEDGDTRVLVDPGTLSVDETFALEGLDAVVVTHQHADHVDHERIDTLLERNRDALVLADPETVEQVQGRPGADRWQATADGAEHTVGGMTLTGVGSTHAEILPTLPRVSNVGLLVRASSGPTVFHPGDSYASTPTGVDVLALPLTAPWAKVSETVAFAQAVAPRTVVPVHDCTASDLARGMYWNHVTQHAGIEDARRLGQTDTDTFE